MNWEGVKALLWVPVQSLMSEILLFLPKLLLGLLILFVGWLIAKYLVEPAIVKLLKLLAIDKLAEQVQLASFLSKGGVRRKLSELVGAIFYWVVMLAVLMVAFNAWNLSVAAELFRQVVTFLPKVIAAVFMLVIGIFAAAFLGTTVRTAASNSGILQAHLLGQVVQTAVVLFSIVASLKQLEIQFVGEVFLILLTGLTFGCALAFGLGCKDIAGKWMAELIDQVQGRGKR